MDTIATRRTPTQRRSQQTVERILDAAARVLSADGYAAASTNAIAREAGVSPGTLYQYFADKAAIVEALTRRLVADFERTITPVLRANAEDPRALIEAVLDGLERHADVLRAIVDHVPGEQQAAHLAAVRARLEDALHFRLQADRPATVWVVLETAQHLAVRYVLDRPPIGRAAFVETLARLTEAAQHGPR